MPGGGDGAFDRVKISPGFHGPLLLPPAAAGAAEGVLWALEVEGVDGSDACAAGAAGGGGAEAVAGAEAPVAADDVAEDAFGAAVAADAGRCFLIAPEDRLGKYRGR